MRSWRRRRQFAPVHAGTGAPEARPDTVVDARGHLRTEPHRHGLEAFFGAVFRAKTLSRRTRSSIEALRVLSDLRVIVVPDL